MDSLKQAVLRVGLVVAFTPIILFFEILDVVTSDHNTDEEHVYAELD